jgi:hypothetical protein
VRTNACSRDTCGSTSASKAGVSKICKVVPDASNLQIESNAEFVSILYSLVMKGATFSSLAIDDTHDTKSLILYLGVEQESLIKLLACMSCSQRPAYHLSELFNKKKTFGVEAMALDKSDLLFERARA